MFKSIKIKQTRRNCPLISVLLCRNCTFPYSIANNRMLSTINRFVTSSLVPKKNITLRISRKNKLLICSKIVRLLNFLLSYTRQIDVVRKCDFIMAINNQWEDNSRPETGSAMSRSEVQILLQLITSHGRSSSRKEKFIPLSISFLLCVYGMIAKIKWMSLISYFIRRVRLLTAFWSPRNTIL